MTERLDGFRMPGEWELQKSVWIAWPYNKKDWPNLFKNIPSVVAEIIANLSNSQKVNLLINHHNDKIKIRKPTKDANNQDFFFHAYSHYKLEYCSLVLVYIKQLTQ